MTKRFLAFIPLILLILIGAFLFWGLQEGRDPNAIPSALIGKAPPQIDLPAVPNTKTAGLPFDALAGSDGIVLVNVFASWCLPCRAEHGKIKELAARDGLTVYGLNYRDRAADASKWLDELGNPYAAIGFDENGRAGIEWGISGVPETFILEDGVIRHRFAGPIVGSGAVKEFERLLEDW